MKDRTVSMLEYLHDAIDAVTENKESTKNQRAVGVAITVLLEDGDACTWWSVDDERTIGLVGAAELLKHGILEGMVRDNNDDEQYEQEQDE